MIGAVQAHPTARGAAVAIAIAGSPAACTAVPPSLTSPDGAPSAAGPTTAPTTAPESEAPACHASDLRARAGIEGEAGTARISIALTNAGAPCSLPGVPTAIELVPGSGRTL